MAKLSKKSFSIAKTAGSLVGGAAAYYGSGLIPASVGNTVGSAIIAAVGAAVPMFIKGDLISGIGNGLVGAAGYQLAGSLMSGSSPAASGLGLLPGQMALGNAGSNYVRTKLVPNLSNLDSNPIPTGQMSVSY